MKKLLLLLMLVITTTLFSGCMPTNQAEQSLDFIFGSPRIVETYPRDNVEDVNLNSEISISFNKEIDKSTLNNRTVAIEYLNQDLNFNVNPFLNSEYKYENKNLIIKPESELLPNQLIEVKLYSDIKNKEGRELAHSGKGGKSDKVRYTFRFRTGK